METFINIYIVIITTQPTYPLNQQKKIEPDNLVRGGYMVSYKIAEKCVSAKIFRNKVKINSAKSLKNQHFLGVLKYSF